MTSHTPGPWIQEGKYIMSADEESEETIAVVNPTERGDANASLLKAAPELLEALERVARYDTSRDTIDDLVEVAREAIAKARGES